MIYFALIPQKLTYNDKSINTYVLLDTLISSDTRILK